MWPPGAYTPGRVPLPYPPYGTLNFFDQAAKQVLDGIKSHRGTAILPAADRPRDRRALLGRRQLGGRGVLHPRDHRLRLRDRRHQLLRRPGDGRRATCGAGQQPPFGDSTNDCLDNEGFHEADGVRHRQLRPPAVRARLLQRHRRRRSSTRAVDSEGKGTYEVRFTSNEASSIYYTTDGSTPTTASTEYKPPRARALPLPGLDRPGTTLKWIAHDFKGNMSAVKSTGARADADARHARAAPCRPRCR